MHVLLKLSDALCAECMGDGLALAGMLDSVASVEEATLDADKGVVVLAWTNSQSPRHKSSLRYRRLWWGCGRIE